MDRRGKVMLSLERGVYFACQWLWGLFISSAVPAALWSCVCGLADVLKLYRNSAATCLCMPAAH